MKIQLTRHLKAACILAGFLFGHSATASNIVPGEAAIQQVPAQGGSVDLVMVKAANQYGISVNRFSRFEVESRPLQIANVPTSIDQSDSNSSSWAAAQLIVIIADDIKIKNQVELLGPAADILFLAKSSAGRLECINCSFVNTLRVSMATAVASTSITDLVAVIGKLDATSSSLITINNVYAPGSIGVDILSRDINLTGVIDTHSRAVKDARGGYTMLPHGDLTIGAAQVSLMLGDISWDYDDNTITDLDGLSASGKTLNGSIRSTGVKITSGYHLTIGTDINTHTDIVSSVSYKGGTYVPQEGIEIQTFANNNLTLNNSPKTGGKLSLKSHGELTLMSGKTFTANTVELIAAKRISNSGKVNAKDIGLGAMEVVNQGELNASSRLEIWSEKDIANQYGGLISADTIKLISNNIVRNGSRTPYISKADETNYLLDLYGSNYVDNINATQLGTYYSLKRAPAATTGVSMASINTAHILGRSLEIKAKALENINPFYINLTDADQDQLEIDRDRLDQVRIAAEEYIGIDASNYVLNSSAQIMQNLASGKIIVNTGLFSNERYRVHSILHHNDALASGDYGYVSSTEGRRGGRVVDAQLIGTRTVSYSPQGAIIALGKLHVEATENFLNNTAYVEVFGSATIDSPFLDNIGLENQAASSITKVYTRRRTSYNTAKYVVDPQELDSLFFVHGNFTSTAQNSAEYNDGVVAENSDDPFNTDFTNHNPLDYYIVQTFEELFDISRDVFHDAEVQYGGARSYGSRCRVDCIVRDRSEWHEVEVATNSLDSVKADGTIIVSSSQLLIQGASSVETNEYRGRTTSTTTSDVKEYSLFDELVEFYNEMKNSIATFFDEVSWW